MYLHKHFQRAFKSLKRFIVFWGGRAGSKTISTGIVILSKALSEKCRILCTRKFQVSIKDSVYSVLVELIEKNEEFRGRFEILKTSITCRDTGSEIIFRGCQNMSEIKSMQGLKYVWIEEANFLTEEDFETLSKTIRTPGAQIWVIFNPHLESDYVYQRFIVNNDPLALVQKIGWQDNPFFKRKYVGSLVDEREIDQTKDIAKYSWIWEGSCITQVEGALFNSEWIKIGEIPEACQTVVAIDPSTTSTAKSDDCGLVVVSYKNGCWYIVDDLSGVMSPLEWANKAILLYNKYNANKIIYESNQGGDMVKTIIHQLDKTILVKGVHATKNKTLRAEPVAALYEQGLVYHKKRFSQLEYEMTTYTGEEKSPNHLDAMVYGVTSFMKEKSRNSSLSLLSLN